MGLKTIMIGDLNLDYVCWETPTNNHKNMIEQAKMTIGSSAYYQVVEGITHTWPGVRDTLIDHCWVNSPEKIIQTMNIENSSSDHNIIEIQIRLGGTIRNCKNFKKRK